MVELAADALDGLAGKRVLDVATGAGHTAITFARAGANVAALDLTPEMLEVARELAAERLGEPAIAFHEGPAEVLPFDDAEFDAVTCRIAAHHFQDPERFLAETQRVLARHGRLLLVDNIAPEEPTLSEAMNRIERMRDPSHVAAYPVHAWLGWMADAGLATERVERFRRTKVFADWAERGGMSAEDAVELERHVLRLPPEAQSYFGVRVEEGRLVELAHEVVLAMARVQP